MLQLKQLILHVVAVCLKQGKFFSPGVVRQPTHQNEIEIQGFFTTTQMKNRHRQAEKNSFEQMKKFSPGFT